MQLQESSTCVLNFKYIVLLSTIKEKWDMIKIVVWIVLYVCVCTRTTCHQAHCNEFNQSEIDIKYFPHSHELDKDR
jgi:hypothetical protein